MNHLFVSDEFTFFNEIKSYISKSNTEIIIIVPYIQTKCLIKLLESCNAKVIIITTWKLKDLELGISELDLYIFCKKNNFPLYINNRIHLKAFVDNYSSCFFGSANISSKGLAMVNAYNYELCFKVDTLDIMSVLYFKKILLDSILVNDHIYDIFVKNCESLNESHEKLDLLLNTKNDFLISSLPMSSNVHELYEIYSCGFDILDREKRDCAIHDIARYKIPLNLNYVDFFEVLSDRFLSSPFIVKLLSFIDEKPRFFGSVKEWIQRNCEDVPIPSRRSLTGNIQVLYRWIVFLSNNRYCVDRPNYSERIFRRK